MQERKNLSDIFLLFRNLQALDSSPMVRRPLPPNMWPYRIGKCDYVSNIKLHTGGTTVAKQFTFRKTTPTLTFILTSIQLSSADNLCNQLGQQERKNWIQTDSSYGIPNRFFWKRWCRRQNIWNITRHQSSSFIIKYNDLPSITCSRSVGSIMLCFEIRVDVCIFSCIFSINIQH